MELALVIIGALIAGLLAMNTYVLTNLNEWLRSLSAKLDGLSDALHHHECDNIRHCKKEG